MNGITCTDREFRIRQVDALLEAAAKADEEIAGYLIAAANDIIRWLKDTGPYDTD